MIFLYKFIGEVTTALTMLGKAYHPKSHSLESIILYGVLNLFTGVYLVFSPKKIIRILLNDKHLEETDEKTKSTDFKNIGILFLKLFGVYLFYQFMYCSVTAYNVAAGNWTPGETEASAYVIQAIFHLGVSLFLIFRTRIFSEIIFQDVE